MGFFLRLMLRLFLRLRKLGAGQELRAQVIGHLTGFAGLKGRQVSEGNEGMTGIGDLHRRGGYGRVFWIVASNVTKPSILEKPRRSLIP